VSLLATVADRLMPVLTQEMMCETPESADAGPVYL